MFLRKIGLSILALVFFVSPVFSFYQRPAPPLVSAGLVEEAGLRTAWQNKLPLETGEYTSRIWLRGDGVYVLSSSNYLFCLNKNDGTLRFAKPLASPDLAVFEPQLFENHLIFVAGNTLLKMNPNVGTAATLKQHSSIITCPAVRNSANFYLAGADMRLHVFDAETGLIEFQVAAECDCIITSIVATEETVVFSTQAGDVVSFAAKKPVRNWRFDTGGPISAPLLVDDESLFVGSQDTNLYKIDMTSGRQLWKFQTGSALVDAPRLTSRLLYQPARRKGLYAIDKQTGKEIWHLADGLDLLAEINGKAYIITTGRELVVIDNNSTEKLHSVSFPAVSKYAANTTSKEIYIADDAGRIACLEPID